MVLIRKVSNRRHSTVLSYRNLQQWNLLPSYSLLNTAPTSAHPPSLFHCTFIHYSCFSEAALVNQLVTWEFPSDTTFQGLWMKMQSKTVNGSVQEKGPQKHWRTWAWEDLEQAFYHHGPEWRKSVPTHSKTELMLLPSLACVFLIFYRILELGKVFLSNQPFFYKWKTESWIHEMMFSECYRCIEIRSCDSHLTSFPFHFPHVPEHPWARSQ